MNKLRVLVKQVGQPPKEREISKDLKTMQAIVGGCIEPVHIGGNVFAVVNESGRLRNLPVNCGGLVGDFFITKYDAEGDELSLTDTDIEKAKAWITANESVAPAETLEPLIVSGWEAIDQMHKQLADATAERNAKWNNNEITIQKIPAITEHVYTLKRKDGPLVQWQLGKFPKAGLIWRNEEGAKAFVRQTIRLGGSQWRVRRLSPTQVQEMIAQDGGIYEQLESGRFGFIPKDEIKENKIKIHSRLAPDVEQRAKTLFEKMGPSTLLGESAAELVEILCREPYPAKELGIYESVCERALARSTAEGITIERALGAELQNSLKEFPGRILPPDELDTILNTRPLPLAPASEIKQGQHRHGLQRWRDN